MYRRLSIRLLCLALITFFTLPALAQFTRDNAASKKIDEAINEHYLATDFDKAEAVLTGTINACGDKCSPGVIAKAWMYVGIVRGSGKNDQSGAKDAFQKALALDPSVKLDTQLATPETQKTFGDLGGSGAPAAAEKPGKAPPAAAANEDAGDKGGLKCTPDVREVQTRRPIPIQCTSDEEAASMELRYKPFGSDAWKTVKMKKKDDAFRGEVPCDGTGTSGTLKVYVRAKDAAGESVDSFGSKSKPIEFQLSESSTAEPPAYEGEAAPERCADKGECPPDFPGCQAKSNRGNKDWGVACDNSMECKEGLLCNDGTCEAAPACETNADCQTGTCVDNKCSIGDEPVSAAGPYKKNWLGLHFAQDIAIMGGSDVCSLGSRQSNGYACYNSGTTDTPYNSDPFPGAGIATGTAIATQRLLLSFDRAITPNITAGIRIGYAFNGGPPAGKGPDPMGNGGGPIDPNTMKPTPVAGTNFLPFHLELRATYWIGKGVLGKKGLRPYVHVGGGLAQVDAKVKVTVADCSGLPDDGSNTAARYLCSLGKPGAYDPGKLPQIPLDAWRKMGQGFITAGGGAAYAFNPRFEALLNLNLMYMLPTSGIVIQPSIGVEYGF
ncbi:MAG TPA: hypothetical protein VNW92_18635 [Polyangiaceae bacterium]|nr:hypothetical protein [Polyangiaceae bacterium]